jgi:hypothetical protein
MAGNSQYVIDTSSLITMGWHYPPEVFPSVWGSMDSLIVERRLVAPYQVLDELEVKDDNLYRWAKDHDDNLFRFNYTPDIINKVNAIVRGFPGLVDLRLQREQADPYVIALAQEQLNGAQQQFLDSNGVYVVTNEGLRGNRVKIPFVCNQLSLNCCGLLEMFGYEGWRF